MNSKKLMTIALGAMMLVPGMKAEQEYAPLRKSMGCFAGAIISGYWSACALIGLGLGYNSNEDRPYGLKGAIHSEEKYDAQALADMEQEVANGKWVKVVENNHWIDGNSHNCYEKKGAQKKKTDSGYEYLTNPQEDEKVVHTGRWYSLTNSGVMALGTGIATVCGTAAVCCAIGAWKFAKLAMSGGVSDAWQADYNADGELANL